MSWVLPFTFAFVVTAGLVPLLRRLALATGFVDRPGGHKSHHRPTPYLGGVGLIAGVLAGMFIGGRLGAFVVVLALGAAVLGTVGLIDDHRTVMAVVTGTIRRMIAEIGKIDPAASMPRFAVPDVPETIPDIHFRDALDLICEATGDDVRGEPDLAPAHERWLGAWAQRTYGSEWLYVTGYPLAKRPVYTHPDPERPAWSNSFDLLFRGLEVVTGGQRLHRYEDYVTALTDRGIDPDGFVGYLTAFQYGMPPHGGFALGLERFIARIAGIENVREAILFPRDMQRLTP